MALVWVYGWRVWVGGWRVRGEEVDGVARGSDWRLLVVFRLPRNGSVICGSGIRSMSKIAQRVRWENVCASCGRVEGGVFIKLSYLI